MKLVFKFFVLYQGLSLALLLSCTECVSASSGRIAIRSLDASLNETLTHITDSFLSRNRKVEFKSKEQWELMNVQDFKEYDALVMIGFGCPAENPLSNSYAWQSATKDGNTIISSIADLNSSNPPDIREIVDSQVQFTLSGNGTGAYISIGNFSPDCLEQELSGWISEAFMAEFIIRNVSSSRYWKNHLVAWNSAFKSITDDMVKTAPSDTANLPIFIQYPVSWYPLVVNTDVFQPWTSYTSEDGSINGAPTILMKGQHILMPGETIAPSDKHSVAPTQEPTLNAYDCQNAHKNSSKSKKISKRSKSGGSKMPKSKKSSKK